MSINHNNIDQWLFNYCEGNLSPSEISKLEGFLKANPEYHEDADAWKNSFVEEPVPAFDASALIKDVKSGNERKRYALAALALLFIGSVSAYFIINPSVENTVVAKNTITAKTEVNGEKGSINMKDQVTVEVNNSLKNSRKERNALPVVVVVNNFIPVNSVSTIVNPSSVSNNRSANNVTPLAESTQNISDNKVDVTKVNDLNTTKVSNIIENNSMDLNQLTGTHVSENGVLEGTAFNSFNNEIMKPIEINASTIEALSKEGELSSIQENDVKEIALIEVAEENINLTNAKTETSANVINITSSLNPDLLAKNGAGENGQVKQDEIVNNNEKIKIATAKGVKMTNLKNVIVLQSTVFDFQNNASFITQNYVLDGYAGANFTQIGTKEVKTSYIAGISHTMRKIKTTLNGYTEFSNSTFGSSAGIVIQGATNFKFDRHQNLIPSVTLSYNRYGFNNENVSASYFNFDLTGLKENHTYSTSNQVNLNTGLLYHHKKFYASLALNGLLQPNFTYVQNDREYNSSNSASINLVGGTEFVSRKRPELSFSPQIAMNVRNVDARFTTGGYVRYRSTFAGASIDTKGGIIAMAGINHRMITVQYRFVYDKLDETNGFLNAHMLSARFNMKGLMKKQKAILDSER